VVARRDLPWMGERHRCPGSGGALAHQEPTPGVVHNSEMNFFFVNHNSSSY
jgi:hypothetical protein